MAKTPKTLKEYLRDEGITQMTFARENGWLQSSVSGWCNNKVPTLEIALEIERITDGVVTPQSFIREKTAA